MGFMMATFEKPNMSKIKPIYFSKRFYEISKTENVNELFVLVDFLATFLYAYTQLISHNFSVFNLAFVE